MTCTFPDIIGFLGVLAVLISYFLLQISLLRLDQVMYSVANAAGSLMLLYSLYYAWNLSAVIIEVAWLGISLYGIFKIILLKRSGKKS